MTTELNAWHNRVDKSIRKPAIVGIAVATLFVGGFGTWASTAPLASAAVARGLFVATGQNKIIQHLEGGIVRSILIKEGDRVRAGQTLVEMDDTAIRAEVRRLEIKRETLVATKARIDAERSDLATLTFPADTEAQRSDGEIRRILESQTALFEARREEYQAQKSIKERQISAIEQEIVGLRSQQTSTASQLELLDQEIDTSQGLLDKGLTQLSRTLQLKRGRAKLQGDIGQFVSEIGRAQQRILETRGELIHLRTQRLEEASDLYRQTTTELADTEERLNAQREVLRRTKITAPVDGVIVKLLAHTVGGVIGAGQEVMEILPTNEKLLVEAYVSPQDIDVVFPGLVAELRLSALNQRTTPMVLGKVVYVSADKLENKNHNGEYYYLARIELEQASLDKLGTTKIAPGMPAEVYVKTGERTLVQYLLKPIEDSMWRGGRES